MNVCMNGRSHVCMCFCVIMRMHLFLSFPLRFSNVHVYMCIGVYVCAQALVEYFLYAFSF